MPTFKYSKLVRDKIWEWHEAEGHIVEGNTLSGDALVVALAKKLHEEADEVADATTSKELVEEIADVQQIIDDLCITASIAKDEVEAVRLKKQTKKGGFLTGHYIETVSMPDETNEWVLYCRERPGKYPEVQEKKDMGDEPELELGKYRHYKGGIYDVLELACNTETLEWHVVYQSEERKQQNLPSIWVRPYEMFVETVEVNSKRQPRFEKVD